MKKSDEPPKTSDSIELEFPDWSGMDDTTSRLSVETAFRLCEEYAQRYPAFRRQRDDDKCDVEFIL